MRYWLGQLLHPLRLWRGVRFAAYEKVAELLENRAKRLYEKQWPDSLGTAIIRNQRVGGVDEA